MLLSDSFMSENSINIVYDEKRRDWYAQEKENAFWGCGIVSFDGSTA